MEATAAHKLPEINREQAECMRVWINARDGIFGAGFVGSNAQLDYQDASAALSALCKCGLLQEINWENLVFARRYQLTANGKVWMDLYAIGDPA